MFVPSKLHHRSCRLSCDRFVPETFGILCWNVHKKNTKISAFKPYLEKLEEKCNFLLLQEANFRDDRYFTLPHFSYDAAANLEFRNTFYGVLTASKVESLKAQAYLSKEKESLVGTHKSLLLSFYHFEDGASILMLNIHAINFRENKGFNREIEDLLTLMLEYNGAMIIAGDFNTWNKRRMSKLYEVREKLGLKMVPFKQKDYVKSFMGKHLDFIFYRGLELVEYKVYKDHKLSDHNPLYAQFKKI